MSTEPQVEIHPLGTTPGVVPVLPQVRPSCESCEMAVHIGVFFDGTGNNKDWDDADTCSVGQGTRVFRHKERYVTRVLCRWLSDIFDGGTLCGPEEQTRWQ